MAQYRPHDVKNPRIDMVTANCGARIARLDFYGSDHLSSFGGIVLLSANNGYQISCESPQRHYGNAQVAGSVQVLSFVSP
jgi:hypothetical protein